MKKNKRDFSRCRSDSYQSVIMETPTAPDFLTEVSDTGFHPYNCTSYSEELHDIKEQLMVHYWRLINTVLTKRQREIITLYSKEFTQTQIAKKLGVNQSSITKSIHGNCDYNNGRKIYGGSEKKLRKAAAEDPEIQKLIRRKRELEEI